MQLSAGTKVAVESESTERPARTGVIEEVLREPPSARSSSAVFDYLG